MASFAGGLMSGYAGYQKERKELANTYSKGASAGKNAPGKGLLKKAIDKMRGKGPQAVPRASDDEVRKAIPDAYKRGGKVRKTGFAKVHKGERVLTKKQQRRRMTKR